MTYRFLPVVRRGLATRVSQPDPLTADLPARARFPVRVSLSTGDAARVDLRLLGPGDVIGVDPRGIVRTEPVRFARNFPPDQLAAIEFDAPDFPWMFTPAAPGTSDRLRPWLALVVVRRQPGVGVSVLRDRPLPQLVIEPPAVPGDELPDLAESWAWAHVQAVEAAPPTSVADHLRDHPDLNVGRLLCPRRLEPDADYLACLVPTFEVGRLAGLGQVVADAPTTAAAWGGPGGVTPTVVLPLYFHWEFRTGPGGDFESLARRLTPRPVPDTVGRRRMFIGSAHPALPSLTPDSGGIVELEGALRAPDAGTGAGLGPALGPWVEALAEVVNAPARHVVDGASPDAEAVAPPIYGGWPAKVSQLEPGVPTWLGELNGDPRHRAAAGLGAEVVRQHQERFVQAAWEQVGDVLRANELLDRSRFLYEVAARVHQRHVAALDGEAVLSLTAPVHERVVMGDRPLARRLARSTLPPGLLDASFRRMASPRAPVLRRAARVAGVEAGAAVRVEVGSELARGQRALDLVAHPPDGLVASRLLARIEPTPSGVVGPELGTVGSVQASAAIEVQASAEALRRRPPPATVALRPDLAISGVVLSTHLAAIRFVATEAPVTSTAATVATVLHHSLRSPGAAGFSLVRDDEGRVEVEAVDRQDDGTVVLRPTVSTGRPPLAVVVPPPITGQAFVTRFASAFAAHQRALSVTATTLVPPPSPFDLTATTEAIVAAVDPRPVIELRARLAVRIGDAALAEGVLGLARQREPLDPVMVGPIIPEPLYEPLAALAPDRFLPGVGEIPDDTVTMLETNPRFVEAFLIGANHEMSRELLWRRYPTDRRGTPLRRFWDRLDGAEDLGPIHELDPAAALGASSGADLRGALVLLVRGQLLRRYPNAVVYAVPARADASIDPAPSAVEHPLFWGRIDPDVTFVGFDLAREDVEQAPGWYFVIAEQPAEPRFGLDTPPDGAPGALLAWSDLHWGHVGVAPGQHLRLAASGLDGQEKPVIAGRKPHARFGRSSADMAAICFQRPFRAAIHSSLVIAGASPAAPGRGGTGGEARPFLTHAVLLGPPRREGVT